MKRFFIITITILFRVICANADNVVFRASAPNVVEVGERFRVQYSVNTQDVSNFSYPSFSGFDVIYGPSTSSQSSFSIVNGQMTQSSSYTYTFTLMAQKAGNYTIPAASIVVGGNTYKSQSLKIQVVASSGGGSRQQGQRQSGGANQRSQGTSAPTSSSISSSDLFMTATASRTNVYEQEAILVTFKVYTLVNLTQLDGKLPALDGFLIQEIQLPHNKEFVTENYNGRMYHSVIWSQYVLFPQKSGELVIPSVTYEGVVVMQNRAIDPIEAFFNGNGGMVEVKKKITTPRLSIHVSALPDKPANFSGAVGSYTISSSISSNKVKANDAITMKVNVKGTGNMKLISAPEVEFPRDFETYDAKAVDNFSLSHNGLSGNKEFEYLAVPRSAGKYTIPATEFVFFDPASKSYKTLKTEAYDVEVEKGMESGTSVTSYTNNQQDVKELNKDIRYIKTNYSNLVQPGDTFMGSWKFWMAYFVPLLLFLVTLAVGHKRIADNANVAKSRGRKANKIASKRLKVAAYLLETKKQNEFYDEVMRALWGYIADKLNIPQANLNKDNVNQALKDRGVDQVSIDKFIKTLDECEFARYAPGDSNENMETVYNNATNVIGQLEEGFRKTPSQRISSPFVLVVLFGLIFTCDMSAKNTRTADELYANERYQEAANIYESIIGSEGVSAELYYNLGNCYYKLNDMAHAVLNYERALVLDPSDGDIKSNLALARGKTLDKVTPPSEMFFVSWWRALANAISVNNWLYVAIAAYVIMLICILLYVFLSNITARKIGMYGFAICLAVTVFSNLFALSQYLNNLNHSFAVVMDPAVTVKSSPSASSTDLFVIHDGAKVEILDNSMAEWCEIKLEEGKVGWVPVSVIEQI